MREVNILIARRQPPGDRWKLEGDEEIITGIVEVLSKYMRQANFKGDYRLSPLTGELFAIETKPEEEPEIKKYDLYGEL